MKKIYLAGPMLNCNETETADWRKYMKRELSGLYQILDPVDFEVNHKIEHNWNDVVEGDILAIDRCDVLVANCWKASPGTSMELVYAKMKKKIVLTVNLIHSPWIWYHSTMVLNNLEEIVAVLKNTAEKEKELPV